MDEYGDSNCDPPSCKISTYPLDGATEMLDYNVPVHGTRDENLSFLIECELRSEQGTYVYNVSHDHPVIFLDFPHTCQYL